MRHDKGLDEALVRRILIQISHKLKKKSEPKHSIALKNLSSQVFFLNIIYFKDWHYYNVKRGGSEMGTLVINQIE